MHLGCSWHENLALQSSPVTLLKTCLLRTANCYRGGFNLPGPSRERRNELEKHLQRATASQNRIQTAFQRTMGAHPHPRQTRWQATGPYMRDLLKKLPWHRDEQEILRVIPYEVQVARTLPVPLQKGMRSLIVCI